MNVLNNYINFSGLLFLDQFDEYEKIDDDWKSKQNIYFVLNIPKFRFVSYKNSILICVDIQNNKNYHFDLNLITKNNIVKVTSFKEDRMIRIFFDDNDTLDLPVYFFFVEYRFRQLSPKLSKEKLIYDFEVLYIGKSIGTKNSKNAIDRMKGHQKIQTIQSDFLYKNKNTDLAICTCSVEQKNYTDLLLANEIKYTMSKLQVINLVEAGLISYFKPHYNVYLKNIFPKVSHKSYSELFINDYTGLQLELDFSNYYINLYTETKKLSYEKRFIYGKWLKDFKGDTILKVWNN